MASLMSNFQFTSQPVGTQMAQQENIYDIIQKAKQDPLGFEEMIKRTNPEGYRRAMQIRNCANPRAMALEIARAQGINPNILSMLGLN